MTSVAGLQDFRKEGPPADIGAFQFTASVLVFQYTFAGTAYVCAIRGGERAWRLIDYGTDGGVVIASAIGALTVGRTWKEKVVLKGSFEVGINVVRLPSYIFLEIQGKVKLRDKSATTNGDFVVGNDDMTNGNTNIEVIGGEIDGNRANQTPGIFYEGIRFGGGASYNVTETVVDRVSIHDCSEYALAIEYSLGVKAFVFAWNCPNGIGLDRAHHCEIDGILRAISGAGLYLTYSAFNLIRGTLRDLVIDGTYGDGVYCTHSAKNKIYVTVRNAKLGIVVDGISAGTEINATCEFNRRHGAEILADDIRISGTFKNNGQELADWFDGIMIYNANNTIVVNVRAFDDQTPKMQRYGVNETGTSDYTLLDASNVRGNLTGGHTVDAANSVVGDVIT